MINSADVPESVDHLRLSLAFVFMYQGRKQHSHQRLSARWNIDILGTLYRVSNARLFVHMQISLMDRMSDARSQGSGGNLNG
jgi:hypothetical protein